MRVAIEKLNKELKRGNTFLLQCSEAQLNYKYSPEKWSKKEILGHLIDSALNNLQRFVEIQYTDKPYQVRLYDQDKLVSANDYFNSDLKELLQLWLGLNNRIIAVMQLQTEETLKYLVEIPGYETMDLRFLMTDYVDHMEHHLNQIEVNTDS